MQAVPSHHPPGMIVILSGEVWRFTTSAQALSQLAAPLGSVASWQTGCLIAKLLNTAIASALAKPDLQWVWIMGDDHVYRPDVLMNLLDHNVDVVAPFVLNRMPPMDSTIAVWMNMATPKIPGVDFRMKFLEEMPTEGLYKLAENETCGDAGILIRRKVLEATGSADQPWYDTRNSGGWASDDQAFTRKIKQAGFDIHVDVDLQIGHIQPMAVVPLKTGNPEHPWAIRLIAGTKTVVEFVPHRDRKR